MERFGGTARAAVVRGGRFEIENVVVGEPGPGEVLVRCVAVGLCHTDLLARDGVLPPSAPAVLGHEGSGVVVELGPGVDGVEVGDHVVLSPAACRHCRSCVTGEPMRCASFLSLNLSGRRSDGTTAYHDDEGRPLNAHFFGQSAFSSALVVNAHSVVTVDPTAPLTLLGPLGCGFQTGAGTVLNVFDPDGGVVIIGAGAVGLAAVLAAVLVGHRRIVVADINQRRLELALELGATEVTDDVTKLTSARNVFDAVGTPMTARAAIEATAFGGTTAIAGAHGTGQDLAVGLTSLFGRTVVGVSQGGAAPSVLIPRLVEHQRRGRFPIERLVRTYPLDEIERAVADVRSGHTVKPVLLHR